MDCNRRNFVRNLMLAGAVSGGGLAKADAVRNRRKRTIPVALVQFDAVPEQVDRNLQEVERLTERAVGAGARWVMFHEGTLCDYTPRLKELAEPVPAGSSTARMERLARRLRLLPVLRTFGGGPGTLLYHSGLCRAGRVRIPVSKDLDLQGCDRQGISE